MFLLVSGRHVHMAPACRLHRKFQSLNLGKNSHYISLRKNCCDLNLGESLHMYHLSFPRLSTYCNLMKSHVFIETHSLDPTCITYPLLLIKQPANNVTSHTMYGVVESVFSINENLTLV